METISAQHWTLQYIHKKSNHLYILIKPLPASIEKWLSNNCSDKKSIRRSSYLLRIYINGACYINKLAYFTPSATNQENKSKNCQRDIIWFNLPHSESVTRGIGQSFPLTDTYFPKNPPLTKSLTEKKLKWVTAASITLENNFK